SAVASAASLLELLGHDDPALNALALAAAAIETLTGGVIETRDDRAVAPLKEGPTGWAVRAGGILSGPVPLLLRAIGRRSLSARRAAALSALAGSVFTRFGWIAAGRASAKDPAVPLRLDPGAVGAAQKFLQPADGSALAGSNGKT